MSKQGKPTQKSKIKDFVTFTQSSEKIARDFLKQFDWNTDLAIDAYYNQGKDVLANRKGGESNVNGKTLEQLFDKYKDSEEDLILAEGTEVLCQDLQADPTDVVVLVLAWRLGCENMCEFTRKGWIEGWTKLGCDSIQSMQSSLDKMRQDLDSGDTFKEIYQFTFTFAKPFNQKSLPLETAIAFWQLLLNSKYEHLELWLEYLQSQYGKSISKDTWNLFLDFIEISKADFSNHDTDGAWPVVIDGFVDYAREKLSL